MTAEITTAVEAARATLHAEIDRQLDVLIARFDPVRALPSGTPIFKDPSDADCLDPRNKTGLNLTPEGVEILFRLLDKGAGYNSAGRKMSITQTAVRNRKGDWNAAGGVKRKKRFIPYLDTTA